MGKEAVWKGGMAGAAVERGPQLWKWNKPWSALRQLAGMGGPKCEHCSNQQVNVSTHMYKHLQVWGSAGNQTRGARKD